MNKLNLDDSDLPLADLMTRWPQTIPVFPPQDALRRMPNKPLPHDRQRLFRVSSERKGVSGKVEADNNS